MIGLEVKKLQTPIPDYYEILGVNRDATQEEIRSAWRSAARLSHPDAGGSSGLFRLLSVAYDTLSDPSKRAAYDASLSSPIYDQPEGEADEWESEDETEYADEWDVVDEDRPVEDHRSEIVMSDYRRIGPFRIHHICLLLLFTIYAISRPVASPSATQGLDTVLIAIASLIVLWRVAVLFGRNKARSEIAYRQAGVDEVDTMSGIEFEQRLACLFSDMGYQVQTTVVTGDYGADLILNNDEGCTVIQAKRSSRAVGVAAVQEAHTAMAHYGAEHAIVVTNNHFTHQATVLAADAGVTLYDREWLVESMATTASAFTPRLASKRSMERAALRHGAPVLAKTVFCVTVLPAALALWALGAAVEGTAALSRPARRRR